MNSVSGACPNSLPHLNQVKTTDVLGKLLRRKSTLSQQSIDFNLQMLIQRQACQQSVRL